MQHWLICWSTTTIFLLLLLLHVVLGDDYCFGKDRNRDQTRHFSSKTAYEIIKGTNMDKQYLVPGCEPTKAWIFHRHGTRLPSEKFINSAKRLEELREEIIKNYGERRTKPTTNALCLEDQMALKMWHWNNSILPEHANYLTNQGYEDLRGTAKLYQRYYPEVFSRLYNPSNFLFRHTDTQRTLKSFEAFTEGLFGLDNNAKAEPMPEKDLLLRPYDYCESWRDNDDNVADHESKKFREGLLWKNTIQDISTRLGFLYTLTDTDVELMFDMCRYEQAWQVERVSVWCAVFLPEQVITLEYDEDLKYYYKVGYGYEGNQRLNCRVVKDMLQHLSNDQSPQVVVNFGHTTGIQTLNTALGLNKDDLPLTADNYNEQTDRRFQTSKSDPFAANFLAVKYKCPIDALAPEKVVFFLNQNAVNLPWCNVGLCNWADVKREYSHFENADCNEYYCGTGYRTDVTLFTLIIAAIIYLTV